MCNAYRKEPVRTAATLARIVRTQLFLGANTNGEAFGPDTTDFSRW